MAATTKIFGDKLKAARERAFLTQSQLGELLGGQTDENIGRIERSKHPVGITTKRLPALAKALGMTIEQVRKELVAPASKSPDVLIKVPRPVFDALKAKAADINMTVAEYLADHVDLRVTITQPIPPEAQPSRPASKAPPARPHRSRR